MANANDNNADLTDAHTAIYPWCGVATYVDPYTHQLIDSETLDVLRPATIAELQASLAAGPEGHILIDGRRCFVD